MSQLPRRLMVEFKPDGIQLRALYRSKAGPNPGTVRRQREVEQLAREGLRHALEALDAEEVVGLGTSGFATREDTLGLPLSSRSSEKPMKKGA